MALETAAEDIRIVWLPEELFMEEVGETALQVDRMNNQGIQMTLFGLFPRTR